MHCLSVVRIRSVNPFPRSVSVNPVLTLRWCEIDGLVDLGGQFGSIDGEIDARRVRIFRMIFLGWLFYGDVEKQFVTASVLWK